MCQNGSAPNSPPSDGGTTNLRNTTLLSSAYSGLSTLRGGNAQAEADLATAQYRAAQLRADAQQEGAATSQQINELDLQGKMLQSRMLAVAGASGVAPTSPTVAGLVAKAAGLNTFDKQMALYNGQSRQNALENEANAAEYSAGVNASNAKSASRMRAAGTILGGVVSAFK